MTFKLHSVGYDYKETTRFIIDRPSGTNDYLFLLFTTEITLRLDEKLQTLPPCTCILYTPSFPQYYCHQTLGFTNDWFHFEGEQLVDYFQAIGLPLNTPFSIGDYGFIRTFIKKLEKDYLAKELFFEDYINSALQCFFIDLVRNYLHTATYQTNPTAAQLFQCFTDARLEILTNSEKPWTIDTMCNLVQLSKSRFSVLYKTFFNCTPKEDLIKERIKKAQYLLSTRTFSVNEVAYRVGYDNVCHFNRQFKKITGMPPGKWKG